MISNSSGRVLNDGLDMYSPMIADLSILDFTYMREVIAPGEKKKVEGKYQIPKRGLCRGLAMCAVTQRRSMGPPQAG